MQLRQISPLPALCASCSWGELHAATNTDAAGKYAVEHHLLHITSAYCEQTQMVRIRKGARFKRRDGVRCAVSRVLGGGPGYRLIENMHLSSPGDT